MTDWLSLLRRTAGKRDRERAFRTESRVVSQALDMPLVDPRLRQELVGLARGQTPSVLVGHVTDERELAVRLPDADLMGSGHGLVLGSTGAGKTRVVAGIVESLLGRLGRSGGSGGVWVIDHKSELVALVRKLLLARLATLPSHEADRLARRLVVIDPFSETALAPFQVLSSEPHVDPSLQAYDVTTLIGRLGGAELGVRQDSFLFHLVLLGIVGRKTLPELAQLLNDVNALAREAAGSPHPDVRAFFAGGMRVAAGSLDGVRARLERLLRHPGTRLMLGAPICLNFRRLLAGHIVLVDLGSPPLGCEDLGRFWAGLIASKLSRAIFERTHAEASHPTLVVVDEWQEGLQEAGNGAEQYERILSQARSRGVSFLLVSQSLATAARVSSSLPKIVATNTQLQLLFRASIEDARAMSHLLPVTGRRPRGAASPWEDRPRSPYVSLDQEREALIGSVAALPDRTFYLWNRKRPYGAFTVMAREVRIAPPPFISATRLDLVRDGTASVSVGELRALADRTAAGPPTASTPEAQTPPAPPPRRPRRPRRPDP